MVLQKCRALGEADTDAAAPSRGRYVANEYLYSTDAENLELPPPNEYCDMTDRCCVNDNCQNRGVGQQVRRQLKQPPDAMAMAYVVLQNAAPSA